MRRSTLTGPRVIERHRAFALRLAALSGEDSRPLHTYQEIADKIEKKFKRKYHATTIQKWVKASEETS